MTEKGAFTSSSWRDHPVVFGSSVACDIVLAGEGILPVQGRIRWKKGRYRVEASPDAEYVVINGHKMTSSSLHQGDELTVGRCRFFLLRLDEEIESRASTRPARRQDEERTRVLENPGKFTPARHGTARPRPGHQALNRCPRSRPLSATTGCKNWA